MWLSRALVILMFGLAAGAETPRTAQPPRDPSPAAATEIYERLLDRANEAQKAGHVEEALAIFRSVAERKESEALPAVRARALAGMVETQAMLNQQESAWWRRILRFFSAPAKVLAWFIIPLVLVLAYRYLLFRHPRASTRVSFEDLSVPRESRLAKSLVLTNNVRGLLQNPKPVQMSELHVDIMPGTDEAGFNGLRPALAMESILGFEPSDHPVKLASFEFSLRDLFGLLSSVFTRPYEHYLNGWLDNQSDEVQAFAELRTRGSDALRQTWTVRCTGPRARERAIADLAAQIIVGTGKSTMTNNWQSFRSFHEAVKLRFGDQSTSSDADVRSSQWYLERALAHDAANWIARFNLGLALCRDNQPRTALQHFGILEHVFTEVWSRAKKRPIAANQTASGANLTCSDGHVAFESVLTHLQEYPECPFLVLYNMAIAHSSLHDPDSTRLALEILGNIAGLMIGSSVPQFKFPYDEMAPGLSHKSRTELALYALSSQANILAGVLSGPCSRVRKDLQQGGPEQIREIAAEINRLCLREQEQHWRSLQTARAVSMTALARVLATQGQEVEAVSLLHEALAAEPELFGAYLHLAEVYMRGRGRLADDWSAQAEWLLKKAMEISPSCSQAAFLLGSLYAEPLVGRSQESEAIFRKLKDHADACLHMAAITAEKAAARRDSSEPLKWLHRYIVLSSTFTAQGAEILGRLLSARNTRELDLPHWNLLAEALQALQGEVAGPERERISIALARIKDPEATVAFGAAAG